MTTESSNTPPTGLETWNAVLEHLFERYGDVARDQRAELSRRVGEDLTDRVIDLCALAVDKLDDLSEDKANRWLGFVQGVMISGGVLTIEAERDYTRPLFHAIKGVSLSYGPSSKPSP